MFKKEYFVTLPDTDAAGILFFANYVKLAHVIYEEFMIKIDFPLRKLIEDTDYMIYIVHSEADYKKSLNLGDSYELSLQVSRIGNSSFELTYLFSDKEQNNVAIAKTVHAVVSKKDKKPIRIPDDLSVQLEKYQ